MTEVPDLIKLCANRPSNTLNSDKLNLSTDFTVLILAVLWEPDGSENLSELK